MAIVGIIIGVSEIHLRRCYFEPIFPPGKKLVRSNNRTEFTSPRKLTTAMLQLPTMGLSLAQAQKLTPLVTALLRDIDLPRQLRLVEIDDTPFWLLNQPLDLSERAWLMDRCKDLPRIANASYIGSGPLAFYCAERLKLTAIDYHRHCVTTSSITSSDLANMMQRVKMEGYDGIWGIVPELNESAILLPFEQIGMMQLPAIITIVKWRTKHYMSANEYYQYFLRGLVPMLSEY